MIRTENSVFILLLAKMKNHSHNNLYSQTKLCNQYLQSLYFTNEPIDRKLDCIKQLSSTLSQQKRKKAGACYTATCSRSQLNIEEHCNKHRIVNKGIVSFHFLWHLKYQNFIRQTCFCPLHGSVTNVFRRPKETTYSQYIFIVLVK